MPMLTFNSGDSYTRTLWKINGPVPSEQNPIGNPPLPGGTSSGGKNWVGLLVTKFNVSSVFLYNFASSGAGSTQHIAAEMFKDAASIDISHVPYKGSGGALVDLIGGQVQMSFDTLPSVLGQIRNNKIRALAVTTTQRNPQLPNVPTMAEAGYPGVAISAWYGIYMPASTPKSVQDKVHDAVNKVLALPETKARLDAIGAEITPMTQAQFADFHAAEYKRFGDIIKKNNIRMD